MNEHLALAIAPFRKFRHVVYHGYGFQLDWDRMKEGLANIDDVFSRFKVNLLNYMDKAGLLPFGRAALEAAG